MQKPEGIIIVALMYAVTFALSSFFALLFSKSLLCITCIICEIFICITSHYFALLLHYFAFFAVLALLIQFTSYNFQCIVPKFEDWKFEDLEIVELHMRKP
jgi:hypothetical protein